MSTIVFFVSCVIAGFLAGFFLTFAAQVAIIFCVVVFFRFYRAESDATGMAMLSCFELALIGILIGNAAYVIRHINLGSMFLHFEINKNWFLR